LVHPQLIHCPGRLYRPSHLHQPQSYLDQRTRLSSQGRRSRLRPPERLSPQWGQQMLCRRGWSRGGCLRLRLPELLLTWRGGRNLTEGLTRQTRHFPPELLETMRRNVVAPGAATAMLNYYRANIMRYGKASVPAPVIECPTLLLWGEDDIYLGPLLASGNEEFVSNLTARRLPGVSHWVQQDAPQTVNETIASWAREKGLAIPD